MPGRQQKLRPQLHHAGHGRLRALHRETKDVFQPPFVDDDVELHRAAVFTLALDHAAGRVDLRGAERGFHGLQQRVAVVPSTIEWNRVSSGIPFPTSASANAGMLVVPSTSMRSSTPLNAPDEFRIPAIPSKTPRSAFSKRYDAASGVWDGSSACQGPNVPSVWMRPGGVGIGEVRAERPRVVRADILHVELLDLEHARRFARLPSKDSQHGPLRLQIADDEWGFCRRCRGRRQAGPARRT